MEKKVVVGVIGSEISDELAPRKKLSKNVQLSKGTSFTLLKYHLVAVSAATETA